MPADNQFTVVQLYMYMYMNFTRLFCLSTKSPVVCRSETEKKTIWKWESLVLLVICLLVYVCDHTPYLLIILSIVTFTYTQLGGVVNLHQWYTVLRTRWEEHQQHQDSMVGTQVTTVTTSELHRLTLHGVLLFCLYFHLFLWNLPCESLCHLKGRDFLNFSARLPVHVLYTFICLYVWKCLL